MINLIYPALAVQSIPLALCILMDFPIKINTIRMGMSNINSDRNFQMISYMSLKIVLS